MSRAILEAIDFIFDYILGPPIMVAIVVVFAVFPLITILGMPLWLFLLWWCR